MIAVDWHRAEKAISKIRPVASGIVMMAAALSLFLGMGVGALIALSLQKLFTHLFGSSMVLVNLLFFAVPVVLAAGGPLIIRDWWVNRNLHLVLVDLTCRCGYPLVGLRPQSSSDATEVVCPECGATNPI